MLDQRRRCGVIVCANRSVPNGDADSRRIARPDAVEAAEVAFAAEDPDPTTGLGVVPGFDDVDEWMAEVANDAGDCIVVNMEVVEVDWEKTPDDVREAKGTVEFPDTFGPFKLLGLDSTLVTEALDEAFAVFPEGVGPVVLERTGDNDSVLRGAELSRVAERERVRVPGAALVVGEDPSANCWAALNSRGACENVAAIAVIPPRNVRRGLVCGFGKAFDGSSFTTSI
jgi:flavin-dependent dehydrogenase